MADLKTTPVTRLLREVSDGESGASDRLLACVYDHLHQLARARMAGERPGHTLQTTALVHEAYLKLLGPQDIAWNDRGHFFHAAAEAMRRILVDHARQRGALKRGKGFQRLPLSLVDLAQQDDPEEILALDAAFLRLQECDAESAEVIRLRFYADLTVEQTAGALGISDRTVKRRWTYARARMLQFLEGDRNA